MDIRIPEAAGEIIRRLEEHGYEAYLVGGCVRDMLLGRQPEDWDITTSALPAQVKSVFRRTVDTGIQHGTVTVLMGKEGYEVTTYRVDGEYRDGRHPSSVTFTPDLTEDLKRRDFTINAMAYSSRTGFVDRFGGVEDLRAGVIRCVGEPKDRFDEDALRILRAIRFSAQLGFQIEERTWEAVKAAASHIHQVSRERVQVELTKLLLSPHPDYLRLVREAGISPWVSERFDQICRRFARREEEAGGRCACLTVQVPPVKHLRWASFLRLGSPEEAVEILRGLKLDNATIYQVKTLVGWLRRPIGGALEEGESKYAIRRAMSQMEPELFDDLLKLKLCLDGGAEVPESFGELLRTRYLVEEIRTDGDCISLKQLAVTGYDMISAGVTPGRAVGEMLHRLLELVLEEPSRNTREYLLNFVASNR